MKKSKLPEEALAFFRKQGSKGGKKSRKALTAEQRSEQARKAADARWKGKK